MVTHVDAVIGVLSRQGFSPVEAVDAYEIVSDCALGCAVGEIRQAAGGQSRSTDRRRVPAGPRHPARRRAPEPPRPGRRQGTGHKADFTERVLTVLAGIAVRRGEPWEPVLAQAIAH